MNTGNMSKERLIEIISFLEKTPTIACDGYYDYPSEINELLHSFDVDINYVDNYEDIKEKPIEEMDIDNIQTMYTFLLRGERFCDGHIASYVEDGTLLALAKQHLVLLENNQGAL